MGIDISGNSCGRARSSATDSGSDAIFCGGGCFFFVGDFAGRALTQWAAMEGRMFAGDGDLRFRLWIAVLGRAACAFGDCGSHAGYHSRVYGVVGNYFFADADVDGPIGRGAFDREWRSGGADEPLVGPWRSTDR